LNILPILVFLAVFSASIAMLVWFAPSRTQQRVRAMQQRPDNPNWLETVAELAGPFARLSTPDGDWESSPLRIRFLQAGVRNPDARLVYFAAKTVLPLLFGALAYVSMRALNHPGGLGLFAWPVFAALVGCYLPNIWLALAMRRRKREIFENFPDAADLMLVCVEAGMGLDAALSRVADEMRRKSRAVAEEIHLSNLEMRAGGTREKALRNLALRTGIDEIGSFATMLTQADRFGTSIGDSLRVFSDDLRHKRQARAEEIAAKIPTKLLFPLVLCIFPSIVMVIMGPAVIQMIRAILPMLSAGGG
jgi:tight adherence protein C